ncbi:MAG: hypothetical protein EPO24_09240 [Bacteroidetes bacterium]|nr:MAG: hypothetical protein EPO24_09240 [Bacteroidota bacterium]
MRWLADHCVYRSTTDRLISLSQDVVLAKEIGMSEADDLDLIEEACRQNRVLLHATRILQTFLSILHNDTGE